MSLTSPEKPAVEKSARKSFAFFDENDKFAGTFSMNADRLRAERVYGSEERQPSDHTIMEIANEDGVLRFPDKRTSELTVADFKDQLKEVPANIDVPEDMFSLEALAENIRNGSN